MEGKAGIVSARFGCEWCQALAEALTDWSTHLCISYTRSKAGASPAQACSVHCKFGNICDVYKWDLDGPASALDMGHEMPAGLWSFGPSRLSGENMGVQAQRGRLDIGMH